MKFIFKRLGNDPKYERWRWQVFAVTWLAYVGFYLTRKSFAAEKPELVRQSEERAAATRLNPMT
jgi:sugar phosphate permease